MRFHTKTTTQQAAVSYYHTLNSIIQSYYKVKLEKEMATHSSILVWRIQ